MSSKVLTPRRTTLPMQKRVNMLDPSCFGARDNPERLFSGKGTGEEEELARKMSVRRVRIQGTPGNAPRGDERSLVKRGSGIDRPPESGPADEMPHGVFSTRPPKDFLM